MKGLLLIDLQNDFCEGGSLAVQGSLDIMDPINELAAQFTEAGLPVIASKDWHPEGHCSFASTFQGKNVMDVVDVDGCEQILWPDHCVQGSDGAEFHPSFDPETVDHVVLKGTHPRIDSYSAFFDNARKNKTDLDDWLKANDVDELYVGGLALDYCVKYSVLDAIELGYKTHLLYDYSGKIAEDVAEAAVVEMKEAGADIVEGELDL